MTQQAVDCNAWLTAIAQDRDRGAFALLFQHYAPRLKSHLLGRGVSDAMAEELVQEVMLSAWRKAESFDPARGSASSWLFTMARNALIDRIRRERRPEPVPEGDDAQAPDCPERALFESESTTALRQAMTALPIEQATVLKDAYFAGRSMSEIATQRSLPIGTVKTRVRLALDRLRNEMRGTEGLA